MSTCILDDQIILLSAHHAHTASTLHRNKGARGAVLGLHDNSHDALRQYSQEFVHSDSEPHLKRDTSNKVTRNLSGRIVTYIPMCAQSPACSMRPYPIARISVTATCNITMHLTIN